jgi:hypothetical protein
MSDRTYNSSFCDSQSNDDQQKITQTKKETPTPKKRLSKSASLTRSPNKSKSSLSSTDILTKNDSKTKIKNADLRLDLSNVNKSSDKSNKKTKIEKKKWITVYHVHETTFDDYLKDSKLPPKSTSKKKKRSKSSTKKDKTSSAASTSTVDKKAELINVYTPSKKESIKQRSTSSLNAIKAKIKNEAKKSQSSLERISSTKISKANMDEKPNSALYSKFIRNDTHSNDHQNFRLFRSLRRDM